MTNPVAVRFQDGSAVELTQVFAVCDAYVGQLGYLIPKKIIFDDGFESWGKGWWDSQTGKLVRVGSGAYGDNAVLERNVE